MTYGGNIYGTSTYGGSAANPSTLPSVTEAGFLQVLVGGVDRTETIKIKSKSITKQLSQRSNQFSYTSLRYFPTYAQEVLVYYSAYIYSVSTSSVFLNLSENCNNIYRVGDIMTLGINTAYETEYTISALLMVNGRLQVTFTTTINGSITAGDFGGILQFGGTVIDISDSNIETNTNQECDVKCVGYEKIFDKKSINNSWQNVDGRYIINDFCNDTINKNKTLDAMDYVNASIQAEWIETGDGINPVISTTLREGTSSGKLGWTYSAGTATFTASPSGKNISTYTGVSSGTPTAGRLGIWIKANDSTKVSSVVVKIGSGASHYLALTIPITSNEWVYYTPLLTSGVVTGAPDYTDCDYLAIIATETSSSFILVDGIRILENKFFNHYPYITETLVFEDFRVARTKPMEVMQRIAESLGWYWHIDDRRKIHLYNNTTSTAPFGLSATSNNYTDLEVGYDSSRLVNRQAVEGGFQTSTSTYSEVKEGDGVVKEWLMKNLFKNLVVSVNKNTVTDTMEGGTNTTTIVATAHGLVVGDYIVNRSRSNAVRFIDTVPTANSFTVSVAVTGQTTGDTFSLFVPQSVGVEGINQDASYSFMSNFNQKSIRNTDSEAILQASEFILFQYSEVVPIFVQVTNPASISAMQAVLGYTDGIFDGETIRDPSIKSRAEAEQLAQAKVDQYGNIIITITFSSYINGLQVGQQILIQDTYQDRNINQYFIIQQLRIKEIQNGWLYYSVTCSTLLFGMLELLQQLLRQTKKISIDEDLTVNQLIYNLEGIGIAEVVTFSVGGEQYSEGVTVSDAVVTLLQTAPFEYGPGGSPQGRYNLAQYG